MIYDKNLNFLILKEYKLSQYPVFAFYKFLIRNKHKIENFNNCFKKTGCKSKKKARKKVKKRKMKSDF